MIYYQLDDRELKKAIKTFIAFPDKFTKHIISLIDSLLKNDYSNIDVIFNEIRADQEEDISQIIAKILFDHFYQNQMFEEASNYADFLLNKLPHLKN